MTRPILWTSTQTSGTIVHQMVAASRLDIEVRFISLRRSEHRTPEFLAVNPKGEVAALQLPDAGATITEIPAMALWLAEAAPESGLLPADPLGRAKGMEWLAWCHFRMANTFALAFLAKRFTGGDEAAAAVLRDAGVPRAREALAFAEAALAGRPHGTILDTERIAAPDIFLATLLAFGSFLGIAAAEFPRLSALAARVAAHPAIAAAMAREKEIG